MNHAVSVYIEALPEPELQIAQMLRDMLYTEVAGIEERFSFKLPFYHYHGMFCYMNKLKTGGIDLCFCRGKDLVMAYPQLQRKERAIMAGLPIYTVRDIYTMQIRELIIGAAAWQEQAKIEQRKFGMKTNTKRVKK